MSDKNESEENFNSETNSENNIENTFEENSKAEIAANANDDFAAVEITNDEENGEVLSEALIDEGNMKEETTDSVSIETAVEDDLEDNTPIAAESENNETKISPEENSEEKVNSEISTKSDEAIVEDDNISEEHLKSSENKDAIKNNSAEENSQTSEVAISENEESEDEDEVQSSEDEEADDHNEEKDYSTLSEKQLIAAFQNLLNTKKVQEIKNEVEEIKTEFNAKFSEEFEAKKEEFLAEGGNIIDFQYSTPLKRDFNSLYFEYKEKRNNHYKVLKNDLKANLEKRQALIEELKGLWNTEENINTTYNHFKDIQEKWRNAGAIPRDNYNLVWNNYHHHVENFYDFLHLNREFRDKDFSNNLEQKLKLIGRAEELAKENDVNKAFRELQMLHKMWKEEIGPVAKENRDDVWDKFSAATKTIHNKRQDLLNQEEKKYEDNLVKKQDLISQITEISSNTKGSHNAWQTAMQNVQALRDVYFKTGRVPRNNNKEIWKAFKDATGEFNKTKNNFYKDQKKEQYANLEKKLELVKIAEKNKDSEDIVETTQLFKKIQADWKNIGHVPRKDSDKLWKKFKSACNHYFERLNAQKNEANKEEVEHLENKQKMLDELAAFQLTGNHQDDLAKIKIYIADWKEIGRVPYNKRQITQKFNKQLDDLFQKLDLGKKETELLKFENKLDTMVNQDDERKLRNEHFFISKKIDETKDEIRQLENNISFFHHVDENNPLVKEVHKNITKQKEQLEVWQAKLGKIKLARD